MWVGSDGKPHLVPYEDCDLRYLGVAGIDKLFFGMAKGTSPLLTSACMEVTLTQQHVVRVRFEAHFVLPRRRPPAKSDHVLLPICALVGPAFPALQAPVFERAGSSCIACLQRSAR